ncbi:hypothetical protein EVA_07949 [gut metagenome]|uniref:Uncharacterized protein n=1 Tax=gut metagenome TaxID=749906 RepID=J9GU55_9ZZZZ
MSFQRCRFLSMLSQVIGLLRLAVKWNLVFLVIGFLDSFNRVSCFPTFRITES